MAEEKKDKEEAAAEAPAGPKMIMGMTIPVLGFVVANLLVMFGGLYMILNASLLYKKPTITEEQVVAEVQKKEEKKKAETGDGFLVVGLAETTINLRSEQGGKVHYATVEMAIVCGAEPCVEQLNANRAKVDDTVQSTIGARSYLELSSLDVKFRIKHEILNKVNAILKDTAATDVLFTNFLVQ